MKEAKGMFIYSNTSLTNNSKENFVKGIAAQFAPLTFIPLIKCTCIVSSVDCMHTYLLHGLHRHTRCCLLIPDASVSLRAQFSSVNPQAGSRIDPMYSNPVFLQNTSALIKTRLWKKTKEEIDISWYLSFGFFSVLHSNSEN